jgi:Zn-dependent peptidase ImmA (M78 family)
LLEETNPKAVDFIGSASMSDSSEVLASRIKDRFNISLDEFRRQATVEDAFRYLRETIEAAGVYVLLLGNLGSYHTNLPAEVFRGFAIADPIAPFIFVNDQDARAAWAFTALHELTHLWLGATGVSGASMETRIEKYCSDVAGELLLPTGEIRALVDLRKAPFAQVIETLSTFASARNLSRAMVAYRFFRTDAISRRTWEQVTESLRQEWIASRKKQEQEETIGESGGPSYYVVKRHRLGDALLDLIRRSLGEGIITYTKAAQVLGVKPTRVDPLIYGTLLEGRR